MAFKAGNVTVGNNEVASSLGGATSPIDTNKTSSLTLNDTETRILLEALKNSTFKGEMIETVYTLAIKLKNNLNNV